MKAEGHLGRCYLKGPAGDAANAILTAVGCNLRLVPRLAEDAFVPDPHRAIHRFRCQSQHQIGFLTTD
jgi:hypothetical protein